MRDDGILSREMARDRDASPTSIRSDPTANATAEKRRVMGDELSDDEDGIGFWGSRARNLLDRGRRPEAGGSGAGNEVAIEDDSEEDDEEEESDSDSDDAEMREGVDEDDDEEDDDDEDELALLGHR